MMAFDVEEGEITGESEPESEIYHEGGGTHKSYRANAHSTSPNIPLSKQRLGKNLDRSTNKIMETLSSNINSPPTTLPLVISPTKNEQSAFHINNEEEINPDKKWRKRSRWSDDMTPSKETSHQNRRSKDKCDREPVSYEDQSSNDTCKRKLDEYSSSPPHHSTTSPSKSGQLYPNKRGGKFHGGGPPKYFDLDQVPDGEDIDWPIGGGKKADDTSRSPASVVKKQKITKDYGRDNTYEHRKRGNNNIFEEDFDKQLRLAQKQAFGLPEEEDDVREEDDLDDDGRSSKTNSRDAENPFPCAHPYTARDQQQNSTFKEGGGGPKRPAAGRREGRSSQNNFRSKPFNNNRGRDRFHRGGQAPRAQSQSSTKYRGANNRSDNRRGGARGGQRRPYRDTDAGGNYGGSGHRSEERRNNSNKKFGNKNNGSREKIVSNPPKMVCKFYAEGRCSKGQECNFSHDTKLNYKQEVCKYYVQNTCTKGDNCVFMHSEFPCKYFHSGSQCYAGDNCKFSHDVLSSDNAELLQKALNPPNHNQHQSYSNEDPLKLGNSPPNNRSHDTSDLFGDEDFEADTTNTHDKDAHNNSKENQSFKHNFYSDPTGVGSGCDLNSSRDNESSLFGEGSETERDPLISPPSKHTTPVKVEALDNNEFNQSERKTTPPKAFAEKILDGKDAVKKVETEENPVEGPSADNDEQSGDESDDEEDYKPVPMANFLSQLREPTQQQPTPTNSNLNRGSSPVKPLNKAHVLQTSSPLKGNKEGGGRLNSSYMSLEEEEDDDQDESSAKLKIVLEPLENEIKPKKENSRNSHDEGKKEGSGSDGEEEEDDRATYMGMGSVLGMLTAPSSNNNKEQQGDDEEEDDRATYMGMGSVLGMLTAPSSNNNKEQQGDDEEEDDRATYMGMGSVLGMLTAPSSNNNNELQSKVETSKKATYDKEYPRSEGGNWHHKDSRCDRRGDEDWGDGGNYDGRNHDRRRGGGGGGARGNNKYASYNNNQGQSDNYHQQPRRGRGGPRGRGRGFNRKNNDGDGGTNRGRWQGNKRFQQTHHHHHSGTDNSYQEEYYKNNGEEGDYNTKNYSGGSNNTRGGGMGRGGQGFNPRGGGRPMAPNTYMGVMNNQVPPQHNPMYQTPAMLPIPFNPNPYNPNFMMNTFGMNPYQQQPQPQHVPPSLLEPSSLADQYPKPPQREVSPPEKHVPAVVNPQPLMRKGDPRSYHSHNEMKCNNPVPIVKAWILRAITGLCQKRRYQRPANEILELDGKLIDPRTRHPNYKDALNKNPSNPDRASRNTHLDHAKDALHVVAPKSQGGEGSDPRIRRDPRLSRSSLTPIQNNIEYREHSHETEYLPYPDNHSNKSPPPNYTSPNHHNLNNHHRKGSAVNSALERGNNTPDHSSTVLSPSPKLEGALNTTIAKEIVIQPFSQLLGVNPLKDEVGENKLTPSLIPPAGGITLLQNLPLSAKTLPSISGFKIPKKHKPAAPILAKGNGEKAVSQLASSDNNDVDPSGSSSKTKLNISQYRARLGSLSTVLTTVKGNDDNAIVNNVQALESSPSKCFVDRNLKESVFGILGESNEPTAPKTEQAIVQERVDEDDDVIFEKSIDSHRDSTIGGSSNIFATGSVLNNLKVENVFKNGDNIFNMYQEEVEDGAGGDEAINKNIEDVSLGDDDSNK